MLNLFVHDHVVYPLLSPSHDDDDDDGMRSRDSRSVQDSPPMELCPLTLPGFSFFAEHAQTGQPCSSYCDLYLYLYLHLYLHMLCPVTLAGSSFFCSQFVDPEKARNGSKLG